MGACASQASVSEKPLSTMVQQGQQAEDDVWQTVRELPEDQLPTAGKTAIDELLYKLQASREVVLGKQRQELCYVHSLGCIVRRDGENEVLYPIATLDECLLSSSEGGGEPRYAVKFSFCNEDDLIMRFHTALDRSVHLASLVELAAQAMKADKWHADWGDGWDNETVYTQEEQSSEGDDAFLKTVEV
mmetsp:Transcript_1991/g.3727  ORF Transcript_1991/g.3727 Transcript_1991/m.3727 type:complete len:188 (-) Transcript_1991:1-564(-)